MYINWTAYIWGIMLESDDAKKSPVSHKVLTRSKRYLHSKKKRPNKEHRCGSGQIPSEGQVRISHNSRVPKLGWIMRTYFLRVFGFL